MDKFILDAKQQRIIPSGIDLYSYRSVKPLLEYLMTFVQEEHVLNLTMFLLVNQDKRYYISYHLGNTLLNIID